MMTPSGPGMHGILYAEDFDEPYAVPPTPRLFTEAEQDAAVARACALAVDRTQREWEQADEQRRTVALTQLADGFVQLGAEITAQQASVALETAQTMLAMLASMLPQLSAQHGAAGVEAVLRAVLPRLSQELRITLHVAPQTAEQLRPLLHLLHDGMSSAVTIATDDRLAPGDMRLAWPAGTLIRDTAAIAASVQNAVATMLPRPTLATGALPARDPSRHVPAHPVPSYI